MTPYSLERRLDTHRKEMADASAQLDPAFPTPPIVAMIEVISASLETILQHLADVEVDAITARRNHDPA